MRFSVTRDIFLQGYQGKTIGRILFNDQVRIHCKNINGDVVDLACGNNPSYYASINSTRIVRADYVKRDGVDVVVNLNNPIPFSDNSFDVVLFFNALYVLKNRSAALKEMLRILRPGGVLYLSSPFSNIEIPEPDDYCRLTSQGLHEELSEAGFTNITIERFGERFTSASSLLHPFMIFNTVRVIAYVASYLLDSLIPQSLRKRHPAPLGYFCIAKK